MNETFDSGYVLAIESAIEGGSLSLLHGSAEIVSRVGPSGVSRAEDLLVDINDLLKSHGISPRDLALVAASAGPGSFTGLRIGLATALGLARGSGARFASISSLYACAAAGEQTDKITVCLPLGRGAAAVQGFAAMSAGVSPTSHPEVISVDRLAETLSRRAGKVLIHRSLADACEEIHSAEVVGPEIATAVGRVCALNPSVAEPLFLSKN